MFVDYKGINVADDTKLRADMRNAGVEYTVYKNTMIRLAAQEAGIEGLEPYLAGTTAIALSETDVAAPQGLSPITLRRSRTSSKLRSDLSKAGL